MPIEPADKATLDAISDILSRFLFDFEKRDSRYEEFLGEVYTRYQLGGLDATGLNSMLSKGQDVGMREQNKFLHLEFTEDKSILPLVTLHSSDNWVHFRIYALLAMLDDNSNLQCLAIRFETDEGDHDTGSGFGSHDFCHAQLCNDINKHIKHVTPSRLPDSQPSIPLDADDHISLVLCMLTSLYGGAHVRRKFSPSGDSELLRHLNNVRALRG